MSGSHSHGEGISSNKMWFATAITFAFCLGEALVGLIAWHSWQMQAITLLMPWH